MSYLSPQADEIIADNSRQPMDMSHSDWLPDMTSNGAGQAAQGTPWLRRQPPRLRHGPRD